MRGGQEITPARGQAQPGARDRYARAASTLKIAQKANVAKVFASFVATLDPATLAALGLVAGHAWGAAQ